MATNLIADGNVLSYTNTSGSAIASGDAVVIGDVLGVAKVDIPDTETGDVAISGVWELPANTAALGQGDAVAFNGTEIIAAVGAIHGYCYKASGAGVLTAEVILAPSGS